MALPRSASSDHGSLNRRLPASSSRSSAVVQRDKYLIFGSDWYFLKDGILDVDSRFQSALQTEGLVANCKWNDTDYTFEVVCQPPDSKLVQHFFHTALYAVIREEEHKNGIRDAVKGHECSDGELNSDSDSGSSVYTDSNTNESSATVNVDEDREIESWKIQRLKVWMTQHGFRTGPQFGAAQEHEPFAKALTEAYPSEFANFTAKHTWSCGLDLATITDGNLWELMQLTGCHLAKGENEGVIYIGADVEQDVHMAIIKLDIIRKYSRPKIYNAHLFYTEDIQDFELSLKYLTDVKIHKKRFFQTTLLDNVEELYSEINNYNNLNQALMVRCAPWVIHQLFSHKSQYTPNNSVKLLSLLITGDNDAKERCEWAAFCYNSKEGCSGNPLNHFSPQQDGTTKKKAANPVKYKAPEPSKLLLQPQPNPKIAEIEKWNAHVPEAVTRNPQPPKAQLPVTNAKPAWDTYREWGRGPTESATILEKPPVFAANTTGGKAPTSTPRTRGSFPTATLSLEPKKLRPKLSTGTDSIQSGPNSKYRSVSKLIATDNLLVDVDSDGPLPSNTTYHSILDENISALGSTFEPLTPVRPSPTDTLQAVDEVGTRNFRNTMNQKAGKPKNYSARKQTSTHGRLPLPSPPRSKDNKATEDASADPISDFVEGLAAAFDKMINQSRGFRGIVTVQAEFGRILIKDVKHNLVADKEMPDLTLDRNKLDFVLKPSPYPKGIQPTTSFTNKLTSSTMDMDDLVKLKGADGKPLWEPKMSYPWEVKYEFIFHEVVPGMSRDPFTIEIDAERFSSDIKVYSNLGNIYVHGTKRHWDYKIVASGARCNEGLKERYGPLEEAIRESLHIPPNLQKPELCFELNRSMRNRFKLDEIRIHRISQYRSKDQNSILQISQIQALDTNNRGVPGKDLVVFKAWLNTSQVRKPCQKLDSWCQATISCIKADEMLKQNATLELGEEVSWTPATFARIDAVKALSLPACEMLKQMDAIGYHNENGVERKPRPSAAQQPTPTKTNGSGADYGFW